MNEVQKFKLQKIEIVCLLILFWLTFTSLSLLHFLANSKFEIPLLFKPFLAFTQRSLRFYVIIFVQINLFFSKNTRFILIDICKSIGCNFLLVYTLITLLFWHQTHLKSEYGVYIWYNDFFSSLWTHELSL